MSAPQGSIITLEIEDFEMEPERDFILVRDGAGPDAPVLQKLTGSKPPQFVVSTGNQLYVYIQTDQADSRRGFRIKYYEGKKNVNPLMARTSRRCKPQYCRWCRSGMGLFTYDVGNIFEAFYSLPFVSISRQSVLFARQIWRFLNPLSVRAS